MTATAQSETRPCDSFPAPVDAKRASHVLVRSAVVHTDRCGACGAVLPVEPWRIAEGVMPVCPPCGAVRAPELAWLAERLNGPDAGELPTDLNIGVRYSDSVPDSTCIARGWSVKVERRTVELGRVGSGQSARLYSVGGGEDAAPALARTLHDFYQTRPEPRALPDEPQPETAEQSADRERRARGGRALDDLAIALFGRVVVAADQDSCRRRAGAVAAALSELFAVESAA